MHGFLCINKELGITSHDVVAAVRRITHIKTIGHAGTLDPAASGVLVVAIGMATRLIEYIQDDTHKTYRASICFGHATDSDDATGTPIATSPVPTITSDTLQTLTQHFTGMIQQVPPRVSALHHNGERMYDLARRGIAPELPARPVHIYQLTFDDWAPPILRCTVTCGKGTYIRALARDFGIFLQSASHLCQLERTAVGDFTLSQAVTLAQLRDDGVESYLLPLEHAVHDWAHLIADDTLAQRIRYGQSFHADIASSHTRAAVLTPDGLLLAIVTKRDDLWHPHKVFLRDNTP